MNVWQVWLESALPVPVPVTLPTPNGGTLTPTVVALPPPETEMFETPSATVTFAGPAYEPVNSTILALFAVPAEADPTQTAATASIATALVSRCFLKVTPFVDVLV